jgi:predicted esterase
MRRAAAPRGASLVVDMKFLLLFTCLLVGSSQLAAASDAPLNFAEADYIKLVQRLTSMEESAPHPLFSRHCRSLRALVHSEWGRALLYPSGSKMAELVRSDLATISTGMDAGNDRWEAFRDAGQPLVLAHISTRDQTLQIYHLVLPKNWDETRQYPLYLELHAYGGPEIRPLSWTQMTLGPAPDFQRKHCAIHTYPMVERDGFHVMPYGRGNSHYEDIGELDVWEALADVEATLKIDERRRYLHGFSMGGSGTYLLAAKRPELWAAVAILGSSPGLRDAPEDYAKALSPIPVFLWSGEKDEWFDGAQRKAEVLRTTSSQSREIIFDPAHAHEYLHEVQKKAHRFLQSHAKSSPKS